MLQGVEVGVGGNSQPVEKQCLPIGVSTGLASPQAGGVRS